MNAGCIHRVIAGFSFDVGSERQMKETALWRDNHSLVIVSFTFSKYWSQIKLHLFENRKRIPYSQ